MVEPFARVSVVRDTPYSDLGDRYVRTSRHRVGIVNKMILDRPWLLPVIVAFAYGCSHTDFKDFQSLTRDPFSTLFNPERQVLHSSPLIFFLGWPITRLISGNASYLLVTLLGFVVLAVSLTIHFQRMSPSCRATACFIMLSSPLLLVLLRWMGKSDPYVIAFYSAMLNVRGRTWPTVVLATLMVAAHREIGTVMLVGGLILEQIALMPVVVGAFVGHSIVWGYLSMLDPKPLSRMSFALSLKLSSIWRNSPVCHLALGPGWFWVFISRLLNRHDNWRVLATLALCFAAAAATADYTRVFILCAVPLIAYAADRIPHDPDPLQAVVRWPALFALQAQIEGGDQVRDSM